ncbi:glycosyltransferase [Dankookia rubra]|uniref:glycosyltransferase n=1 Tax=Dankookia rubra TaxID=1442381 RepID=UPI001408CC9F|nr:glycosyltransferase [Dankookia rubra]
MAADTGLPEPAARSPGVRLLVVCHTHPRFSRGGAEITAYETFRRAAAQPGVEAWFFASNGKAHGAKIGVSVQQPFGPREFVHTGEAYEQFKLSNPDPAFEREFGRVLREVRPDVVHFHHYLGVGVEAFLYVRRHAPQAQVILTLHEYLIICNHHGQMVTRPNLDLCKTASPQRCGRCFPEQAPQLFFLRRLWLQRFLREVDTFIAPSNFLKERYVAWGLDPAKIVVLENFLPHEQARTACGDAA